MRRFLDGDLALVAAHGFLPPLVFRAIQKRFVAQHRERKASLLPRTA